MYSTFIHPSNYPSTIHPSIHSFVCSFVRSFIHSFIHTFLHSCHSFSQSFLIPPFTHSFIHFSYSFHHLLVRYLIFNINSFNASINSFIHPFKVRFHIFLFNDCAEVLLTGHQMLNCTYMRDLRTQEYVGIEEANLQPNKKIRTFVSCSCFFASLSICLLFLDAIFSSSRRR